MPLINEAQFRKFSGDGRLNKEEFLQWMRTFDTQSPRPNGKIVKKPDGTLDVTELTNARKGGLDVSRYAAKEDPNYKYSDVSKNIVFREMVDRDINFNIQQIADYIYKKPNIEFDYKAFNNKFQLSKLKKYYIVSLAYTPPGG